MEKQYKQSESGSDQTQASEAQFRQRSCQYNAKSEEQRIQQRWEAEKTNAMENYHGALYSVDTPPPTVSGSLHIGHIFSYTQTDIIARYQRLQGKKVFYPFGFDDNGLPTERFVEKKKEITAYQLGRSAFINVCLEVTAEVEKEFEKLWRSIGLSVDWDSCYSTISASTRALSQASFIELYKKGYVYRKYEPALYCTVCRTSVAQAELEDVEKPSFFNDIIFKTTDGQELVIGTTRPELLPACVAMLYNPDDPRYQHLAGKKAIVPLFGQEVPILADESVQIDKGTGLVMVCTFGDKTDIAWVKKFNLPYRAVIGLDGKWTTEAGFLAGLKAEAARNAVLEKLKEQGLLKNQKPITHAVNVHERCKREIEFMPLKQWFVNILDHKKTFIEMADQINWYPTFMKSRYNDWVEHLGWDWCISRQRFFGIPFPAWYCASCNAVILADEKQLPVDPQETAPASCTQCGGKDITPDRDVMDTWNTSSLTPYICAQLFYQKTGKNFDLTSTVYSVSDRFSGSGPKALMTMRPQAHDIIRTWAFDTIVKVWMHQQTIPWNNIIISGHVLADSKEKLSKSKGNERTTPHNLLERYSADVIRYWTASGSLGQDIPFTENQLNIGQRLVTKIWNAMRFIAEHVQDVGKQAPEPIKLYPVNEWILDRASNCFSRYHQAFEQNEFGHALNAVEEFFWQDVCDNYLELVKDQLFKPEKYPADMVAATKWTLHHLGLRLLQLYAPYLPHVTEAIFESVYKNDAISSIHHTSINEVQKRFAFPSSVDSMTWVLSVIAAVRKLKSEKQLSLKTPLHTLIICSADQAALDEVRSQELLIKGVSQAETIVNNNGVCDGSLLEEKDGTWHARVGI